MQPVYILQCQQLAEKIFSRSSERVDFFYLRTYFLFTPVTIFVFIHSRVFGMPRMNE